jgi:hypothetical protein
MKIKHWNFKDVDLGFKIARNLRGNWYMMYKSRVWILMK